jgi:hypothetical protein
VVDRLTSRANEFRKKHLRYEQSLFFLAIVLLSFFAIRHDERVTIGRANRADALVVKKAIEVGNATNRKIVQSQINGCRRGHRLRDQVNYDTGLIREAVKLAANDAAAHPDRASQARAKRYEAIVAKLRDVPQPDCAKVIYRP